MMYSEEQIDQMANRIINTALPPDAAWALTICVVLFAKVGKATGLPADKAALMVRQAYDGTTKKSPSGLILPG